MAANAWRTVSGSVSLPSPVRGDERNPSPAGEGFAFSWAFERLAQTCVGYVWNQRKFFFLDIIEGNIFKETNEVWNGKKITPIRQYSYRYIIVPL